MWCIIDLPDLYADLRSDFTNCCIYLEALRVLLTGTRGGTRHLRTFIFSGVWHPLVVSEPGSIIPSGSNPFDQFPPLEL
jgi:hypothetical protein